jgi:CRISPR-associated endonuclease/helicase Cas3
MSNDEPSKALRYWAKTTADGLPGIDVDQHLLRVARVAGFLAAQRNHLLERWQLTPAAVAFLAGLHDVGKISMGFQSKCGAWLEGNQLLGESISHTWVNGQRDHSRISQFTVQRLLAGAEFGLKRTNAIWWATAVGCHHGRLHYPGERGLDPEFGMMTDEWEEQRHAAALSLYRLLTDGQDGGLSLPPINSLSAALWCVAGLISVADWIGSDELFFPANLDLADADILDRASRALDSIGLGSPQVTPGLSFTELFPFSPNHLQVSAVEFIREPGLYVIEAPMGMGKTEAALAAAYNLLCSGLAAGIYFALPTQATSNRIHGRLADFVQRICPQVPSTMLIHANSWLMQDLAQPLPAITPGEEEDTRCSWDWFASAKRALLAPFGVGTVDQALLSIVAAKHFFVRRYALANKVVIVDEVHSYDVYTGTLIGKLCAELIDLGCTVILLSATLTRSRRNTLQQFAPPGEESEGPEPYPMISGTPIGAPPLSPMPTEPPPSKSVAIRFISEADALGAAVAKARDGACVLWICNTVNRAQKTFRRLKTTAGSDLALGLLHARFPFFRRQELEDKWMTALGKDGERPKGCILVSTQIVEQSVDLDADLMLTELAPTDMLLQRMGRLWRHGREHRPVGVPQCWIVAEETSREGLRTLPAKELKKALGSKAHVYAPYVLLRSLEVWTQRRSVVFPDDIRTVLEETYNDTDKVPPEWLKLRSEIEGQRYAERLTADMNANPFKLALPDDEGVQTRLNAAPTVSVILAQGWSRKKAVLLNGERAVLQGKVFDLDTARALHRNLVRVPKWIFESFQGTETTSRYVRGEQTLAAVDDERITVSGLKSGVTLRWDQEVGLEILFDQGEDDESCD